MTTEKKGCLAFAVCGSFCTLEDALGAAQALTAQGWTLLPVMSFAAQQDTRFGTGESWRQRLQAVTGQPVLDTLQAVEPLGPRRLAQALVVAPCTGATLARLAAGLSDTPVTLAAKSLLRVGSPVVLAVSTNDGLGASGENMARLCVPAQALLLCALRAGRPLCQAPEPEGRPCPAARRRGRRFAG